jgi:hypothetical protein
VPIREAKAASQGCYGARLHMFVLPSILVHTQTQIERTTVDRKQMVVWLFAVIYQAHQLQSIPADLSSCRARVHLVRGYTLRELVVVPFSCVMQRENTPEIACWYCTVQQRKRAVSSVVAHHLLVAPLRVVRRMVIARVYLLEQRVSSSTTKQVPPVS